MLKLHSIFVFFDSHGTLCQYQIFEYEEKVCEV
jgi:hypothetical protein